MGLGLSEIRGGPEKRATLYNIINIINIISILVPWLKRHLAGAVVPANVLKLSGGNSSMFKDEAMELFKTR